MLRIVRAKIKRFINDDLNHHVRFMILIPISLLGVIFDLIEINFQMILISR